MRIKHNDLTHYFLRDHDQLPRAYLRKCEKFFQSIQDRLITKKDGAFLFKHQAPSNKRQAVALWRPGVRVKNRFNRKV